MVSEGDQAGIVRWEIARPEPVKFEDAHEPAPPEERPCSSIIFRLVISQHQQSTEHRGPIKWQPN